MKLKISLLYMKTPSLVHDKISTVKKFLYQCILLILQDKVEHLQNKINYSTLTTVYVIIHS